MAVHYFERRTEDDEKMPISRQQKDMYAFGKSLDEIRGLVRTAEDSGALEHLSSKCQDGRVATRWTARQVVDALLSNAAPFRHIQFPPESLQAAWALHAEHAAGGAGPFECLWL